MNKKLIAIIVAVVVAIVAVVGIVIAVSNKDDSNTPDQNQVETNNPNVDNNDAQKPSGDNTPSTPENPDTPQEPDTTDKNDNSNGGHISIGPSDELQDNGENEKPVERCKYCNHILVSKYDPRYEDLDNYCDGDCIGWLG